MTINLFFPENFSSLPRRSKARTGWKSSLSKHLLYNRLRIRSLSHPAIALTSEATLDWYNSILGMLSTVRKRNRRRRTLGHLRWFLSTDPDGNRNNWRGDRAHPELAGGRSPGRSASSSVLRRWWQRARQVPPCGILHKRAWQDDLSRPSLTVGPP